MATTRIPPRFHHHDPLQPLLSGMNLPVSLVTDALGRRIVPIDKPVFSIGRRSETRRPGRRRRRVAAPCGDRHGRTASTSCTTRIELGTFVNGERDRRAGARARRPHSAGTVRATRRSCSCSTTTCRRSIGAPWPPSASCGTWRRCSRGFARSGRPRAGRSAHAGARLGDRGHRRRARLHHARRRGGAARVQAGTRARCMTLVRPHLRHQPQDSRNSVRDRQARRSSKT